MQVTLPGFTGYFDIATYRRRGWLPRLITIVTHRDARPASTEWDIEGEAVLTIRGGSHRRAERRLLDLIHTTVDLDHLRDAHRPPHPSGLTTTWTCSDPACGYWSYGHPQYPLGDGTCSRHPGRHLVRESTMAVDEAR